jgi:enamine deaminase RidA (YjgF/YER057c/UK114 family)
MRAQEEGNRLLASVLQAAEAMVQACANIDATCRLILAACEPEASNGSFIATLQQFTAELHAVSDGMKALPDTVSGRVSGDVAEAVRLFGSEVEPTSAPA